MLRPRFTGRHDFEILHSNPEVWLEVDGKSLVSETTPRETEMLFMILPLIALIGFGGASLPVMFWAMLPDTIEYGEARSGVRAESRTFGFATFAQKAAVGINALLLGALLNWSGFQANAALSSDTLLAIKAIMALVPAVGNIAIWLILRGYPLDRAAHDELVHEIEARRAG